jgi:hypothetical protein
VSVTFDPNTVDYACNCTATPYPQCMYSWNKLWGSSRCGFANHHHEVAMGMVWNGRVVVCSVGGIMKEKSEKGMVLVFVWREGRRGGGGVRARGRN